MIRSMYSGISGMKTNQTKMDVIGNNIANATTTAFKSGRVRFQDMFSQTEARAQEPTVEGRGGVNPKQVGQGVTIAAIDTIFENAPMSPTGRDLDLGIEGNGFFVVAENKPADADEEPTLRYTRDGAFYKDKNGNLVTADGLRVMGWADITGDDLTAHSKADDGYYGPKDNELVQLRIPDVLDNVAITDPDSDTEASEPATGDTDVTKLETFYIDGNGLITGVYDNGETYYLGRVAMAQFKNQEGLEKLGGNTYGVSRNSGDPDYGKPGTEGMGVIRQGNLEMSNVDLANEFTDMIVTSRAYQANSRIITTSDEMLQELVNLKR